MTQFARVKDGQVLDYRGHPPIGDQSKLAPGKPRFLPVVDENAEHDPLTQVADGPEIIVEADRVVRRYTVREKSDAEVIAMRKQVFARLDDEFIRRATAPIRHTVGGTEYEFHADDEAVQNIMGVVLLIAAGVPVPNPRKWSPKDVLVPIDITHAELIGLGAAIAARKDALHTKKKQKQVAVSQKPARAVSEFDAKAGWD